MFLPLNITAGNPAVSLVNLRLEFECADHIIQLGVQDELFAHNDRDRGQTHKMTIDEFSGYLLDGRVRNLIGRTISRTVPMGHICNIDLCQIDFGNIDMATVMTKGPRPDGWTQSISAADVAKAVDDAISKKSRTKPPTAPPPPRNPNIDLLSGGDDLDLSGLGLSQVKSNKAVSATRIPNIANAANEFNALAVLQNCAAACTTIEECAADVVADSEYGMPIADLDACCSTELADHFVKSAKKAAAQEVNEINLIDSDGDDNAIDAKQQVVKGTAPTKHDTKRRSEEAELFAKLAISTKDVLRREECRIGSNTTLVFTAESASSTSSGSPIHTYVGTVRIFSDGSDGTKVSMKAECGCHPSCEFFVSVNRNCHSAANVESSLAEWLSTARALEPRLHKLHSEIIRESFGIKLRTAKRRAASSMG